jgi:DNA topoisomerase IA
LKNTEISEGYYIYIPESTDKQANEVKSLINNNNYDAIINAYDSDIFGQLFYEFIKESIGFSLPDKRLWYNSLTEKSLLEAFYNFKDNNETLNMLLKENE